MPKLLLVKSKVPVAKVVLTASLIAMPLLGSLSVSKDCRKLAILPTVVLDSLDAPETSDTGVSVAEAVAVPTVTPPILNVQLLPGVYEKRPLLSVVPLREPQV
jgi:hypothetical protein